MVEEKSGSDKKKDTTESCRKIKEEQNFRRELEKNLKGEILNESIFLVALYIFFMDCDL